MSPLLTLPLVLLLPLLARLALLSLPLLLVLSSLELLPSLLLLELLLSLRLPISALEGADGAGGLPSTTPQVPAPASTAGALRVVGRKGPAHVMSGSDSLSNYSTIPPPSLDVPSPLAPSPAVDSPSSAMGGKCCWGAGGAGGTCCQVTLRVISMVRWVVSTRMQSRGKIDAGSNVVAVSCFRL